MGGIGNPIEVGIGPIGIPSQACQVRLDLPGDAIPIQGIAGVQLQAQRGGLTSGIGCDHGETVEADGPCEGGVGIGAGACVEAEKAATG